MPKPKRPERKPAEKTTRQLRIDELRSIPRPDRTAEQLEELSRLNGEEKRERFLRLLPKRVGNLKRAVRGVINLGNVQGYDYTPDEAAAIVAAVAAYAGEVRRAFTGAPREKGLYDL